MGIPSSKMEVLADLGIFSVILLPRAGKDDDWDAISAVDAMVERYDW